MHLLTFYLALLLSTTILASETTVQKLATLECQDEETQWYNGERPGAERPLRTKKVCCKPVAAAKLQQMREAGIPDVDIKYSCVECTSISACHHSLSILYCLPLSVLRRRSSSTAESIADASEQSTRSISYVESTQPMSSAAKASNSTMLIKNAKSAISAWLRTAMPPRKKGASSKV